MQRFDSSTLHRRYSFQEDDVIANDKENEDCSSGNTYSDIDEPQRRVMTKRGGIASIARQYRLALLIPCALFVSVCNVVDLMIQKHRQNDFAQPHGADRKLEEQYQPPIQQQTQPLPPVVDILSIGSLLRPDFQDAQEQTIAQYGAVRNFVRIDERNDTDASCYTDLTLNQVNRVIDFCAQTERQSYISQTLRQRLFEPKKHVGWMCAQKRPLDGLYQLLQRYVRQEQDIPDFVFIIDDDTFINMDRLVPDLVQHYPVDQPLAVAGCIFDFLAKANGPGITFPYGGYGSFLTKQAISRLIEPFYCDGDNPSQHSILACWRLKFNALGERQFYTEGMSVLDLMQSYASNLAFTNVDSWQKTGYCLHSDHALAYFVNFYHITVPEGTLGTLELNDRIRRRYSYVGLMGESECKHERGLCRAEDRLCHYTKPAQMKELYSQQQDLTLRNFSSTAMDLSRR